MTMNTKKYLFIILSVFLLSGCGKEFLEKKRDSKQVIPKTIDDYQAMMDVYRAVNLGGSTIVGLVGSDEFTVTDAILTAWVQYNPYEGNGYIWAKEVFETKESTDWNNAYQRILYANSALEVEKIKPAAGEQDRWNNVKGSALFFRALSYYQLAQLFCKPYDATTAGTDMGVPLKTTYDITEKVTRGTVAGLYKQILSDLETAYPLLPDQPLNIFRPGKAAVATLLARTYLQMSNYERADYYANEGLKLKSQLIDFKGITIPIPTGTVPIPEIFPTDYGLSNPEVIFFGANGVRPLIAIYGFNADEELLKTYDTGDVRKKVYFQESSDQRMVFRASYAGGFSTFTGLSTAELWLMRAETRARAGQTQPALEDLNHLRLNRYSADGYKAATANTADEALALIVKERRKEFVFRGIRWEDLRRFNKETRFAKTLKRTAFGKEYQLPPNDPRYVWPIPDNEVELSGLQQNPR